MSGHTVAAVLYELSELAITVFAVSGATVGIARASGRDNPLVRLAHTLGSELNPFIPVAIVTSYLASTYTNGLSWSSVLGLAVKLACWWFMRHYFDDRWKRRGRRAVEKVTSAGHRLVVVPASGE